MLLRQEPVSVLSRYWPTAHATVPALYRYWSDPEVLSKLSAAMGDTFDPAMLAGAGAGAAADQGEEDEEEAEGEMDLLAAASGGMSHGVALLCAGVAILCAMICTLAGLLNVLVAQALVMRTVWGCVKILVTVCFDRRQVVLHSRHALVSQQSLAMHGTVFKVSKLQT